MNSKTITDDQPKRAHVAVLCIDLHWLPMATQIKFKSLMLAYRVQTSGSAHIHSNQIIQAYAPFSANMFPQGRLSGIAIPAYKDVTVQTVQVCG